MKFNYKIPQLRIVKSRHDYLSDLAKDMKVLHVGCVDRGLLSEKIGTQDLLHDRLAKQSKEITGLDIDTEGINIMRQHGYTNLINTNIETWEPDKDYDIIIVGEVIEHIDNCGLFLNSLAKISSKETKIIITTPNAYYYLFWIFSLFRRESIHPDHNYLFSIYSLKQLLGKYNFDVQDFIIVWEKVNFNKKNDDKLVRLVKKVMNSFINIPYYLRLFFPQYGKGLIVSIKLKKTS